MIAAAERDREAYKRELFGAWHAAAFTRGKKLPRLDTLLKKLDRHTPKRQSPEDMLRTVESLNRMFGGRDRRNEKPAVTDAAAAPATPMTDTPAHG